MGPGEERRMRQDTTRIVLYSHDALGLGHLRRNLAPTGSPTTCPT